MAVAEIIKNIKAMNFFAATDIGEIYEDDNSGALFGIDYDEDGKVVAAYEIDSENGEVIDRLI